MFDQLRCLIACDFNLKGADGKDRLLTSQQNTDLICTFCTKISIFGMFLNETKLVN